LTLLTTTFSDVVNFINPKPLSLLVPWKLSFPTIGLKIYSHSTFALKSPYRMFTWNSRNWSNTLCSSWKLSFVSSHLSSVGVRTFRTIISHQRKVSYDLSLTNSTLYWHDSLEVKR
jgi:hypothetical protein